jgi:hypothetical protein
MKTLLRIALACSFLFRAQAVEWQPFKAQIGRVLEALDYQGVTLPSDDMRAIREALDKSSADESADKVEELLDKHCLVEVDINPESRVKVARGKAAAELVQSGWRAYLVKVVNEGGVTAELRVASPQGRAVFDSDWLRTPSDKRFGKGPRDEKDLWLDIDMFNKQPLYKNLSGLAVEYRLVQLYSRDAGKREAKLMFDVGQGTQDLGYRNEVDILFDAKPSRAVTLHVLDEDGEPTTACFDIRDA